MLSMLRGIAATLGRIGRYHHFYENTHIEVLEAKLIMDHSGSKKANFGSSRLICTE
jgi:hypothetical protein